MAPVPASMALRRTGTKTALIDALVTLLHNRRYNAIRVTEIIAQAGVAKSTFYEHFRRKDDVLLAAMQPLLLALSTAASGRAAASYVSQMVGHVWERRSMARAVLDSSAASNLQLRLAEAIAKHGGYKDGDGRARLEATGIAAAQLAMLRCWLAGHVTATIEEMADRLMACAKIRGESARP